MLNNLSLFTGSGIGDFAAAQCGIRTVAMCESDPWCCYALARMFPEAHLFKDVRDVSASALREFGPIDIISGGFPCTDLSTAGRGAGIEGSRSGLWREMFRVIRQIRSTWLVVENVPAIKVRGVDRVLAPLERIGYTCWPLVVGAEHAGAPHKRHRLWLICRRLDDANPRHRETTQQRNGRFTGNAGSEIPADAEHSEPWAGTGQVPSAIDGACGELGHAITDGLQGQCVAATRERERGGIDAGRSIARADYAPRWPSRPGERQHEWEAPRLVERNLGSELDGLAARVHSRANKALLRACGNGWCYPNILMIYQWIANQERSVVE